MYICNATGAPAFGIYILPPVNETLSIDRISHHLLQIKQTHLILKALDESFQEH